VTGRHPELASLVRNLERAWAHYSIPAEWARAASELLSAIPTGSDFFDECLRFASQPELPRQQNMQVGFGHPPLTLYNFKDDAFFVDVYLWCKPSMAIHDHNFVGACLVLEGETRHEIFDFSSRDTRSEALRAGVLTSLGRQTLTPGDCFEIKQGDHMIHRNEHVGVGSVTLVARSSAVGLPQFSYLETGLAIRANRSASHTRRLQLLDGLLRTYPSRAERYLAETSDEVDPHDLFELTRLYAIAAGGLGRVPLKTLAILGNLAEEHLGQLSSPSASAH